MTTNKDKGDKYELLIYNFLKTKNDTSEIYMWSQITLKLLKRIKWKTVHKNDIGVDIVRFLINGQIEFIQCKNYNAGALPMDALNAFPFIMLSHLDKFGIVYYTCPRLSRNIIHHCPSIIQFIQQDCISNYDTPEEDFIIGKFHESYIVTKNIKDKIKLTDIIGDKYDIRHVSFKSLASKLGCGYRSNDKVLTRVKKRQIICIKNEEFTLYDLICLILNFIFRLFKS